MKIWILKQLLKNKDCQNYIKEHHPQRYAVSLRLKEKRKWVTVFANKQMPLGKEAEIILVGETERGKFELRTAFAEVIK